jgi:hypothetical protein
MAENKNPFVVHTPEGISAEEAAYLFVPMSPDFADSADVFSVGHTFIHGPRGSGKSMMFRYMEPDCQMVATKASFAELAFLGVYVPIKNHELKLTEFGRLERHASLVLNEHFLTTYAAGKAFRSLGRLRILNEQKGAGEQFQQFCHDFIERLLVRSGWHGALPVEANPTVGGYCSTLVRLFDDLYREVVAYLRQIALPKKRLPPYSGVLCGYLDFLFPLLRGLRELTFMPHGSVYLLVDDADNLSEIQTTILNSWVSARTTTDVSIKVSTQLNYKTYRTASGQRIDSPHDFVEINLTSVYTSSHSGNYHRHVREIVEKRLSRKGIEKTPEEFFPEYKKQEEEIAAIAEEFRARWAEDGRGNRPGDDAYRYARPEYIKRLGGSRKATSKYRYAGFSQLVHLSSGVVRFFLDAAFEMYNVAASKEPAVEVSEIDSLVQDEVVRRQANEFILTAFDRLLEEHEKASDERMLDLTLKLRNLVSALGGTFEQILISDASERRVFSIALSDHAPADIVDVFRLGISYGYFHQSSIGNKEGTGRTRLYILSKRLAPAFNLDPTGFSGYKFVTSEALRRAIADPKAVLAKVRSNKADLDAPQLELF